MPGTAVIALPAPTTPNEPEERHDSCHRHLDAKRGLGPPLRAPGESLRTTRRHAPDAPLPLAGVRVLDLGHVFQGPYATFLMAMAGAEVIKVEPPHGDMSRRRGRDGDYPFRALNGTKRGIVLNLKTERGRELLIELAQDGRRAGRELRARR